MRDAKITIGRARELFCLLRELLDLRGAVGLGAEDLARFLVVHLELVE